MAGNDNGKCLFKFKYGVKVSTVMWRTLPSVFIIQTDEPQVVRKLSRRKRPQLVGWGVNKYLRIFELSGIRPDNARRTLRYITGREIILNTITGDYEPKTHSYMTISQ